MDTKEFARSITEHSIRIEAGHKLSAAELARQLRFIVSFEVEEGGPYAIPDTSSPDVGLNLAIARFLDSCGVHLPKLDAFLHTALESNEYTSSLFSDAELQNLVEIHRARIHDAGNMKPVPDQMNSDEEQMMEQIREVAENRFAHLPPLLHERANKLMEWTLGWNRDNQIALMPHYIRQALGSSGEEFGNDSIARMGLANIFFWTAFIVYDDFWDEDEAADPQLLPIANLFARHYIDYFSTLLPEDAGFRAFFHDYMDCLDAANAWETTDCRMKREDDILYMPEHIPAYGEYDIKFYPASGHIMGPVALLLQNGLDIHGPEIKSLIEYFKHSLIARQLNDDLHDWKEDLERGHISTVVATLLKLWREHHPDSQYIELEIDMPEFERMYWYEALVPLCNAVLSHAAIAREALMSIDIFEDKSPLERFIVRNERIANEALEEQVSSEEFVSAFTS